MGKQYVSVGYAYKSSKLAKELGSDAGCYYIEIGEHAAMCLRNSRIARTFSTLKRATKAALETGLPMHKYSLGAETEI